MFSIHGSYRTEFENGVSAVTELLNKQPLFSIIAIMWYLCLAYGIILRNHVGSTVYYLALTFFTSLGPIFTADTVFSIKAHVKLIAQCNWSLNSFLIHFQVATWCECWHTFMIYTWTLKEWTHHLCLSCSALICFENDTVCWPSKLVIVLSPLSVGLLHQKNWHDKIKAECTYKKSDGWNQGFRVFCNTLKERKD